MIGVRYNGGDVMRQVQAYAKMLGLHLERQNTGAARYPNADGSERLVRYGTPGAGDLVGVIPSGPNEGRHIEVECKATNELPTMHQFDRIVRINQAGGIAFWVDSLEMAMYVLQEIMKGARIRYLDITRAEVFFPCAEAPRGGTR